MLSISLGFWVQKNYLNKKEIVSPKAEKKAGDDKYNFITSNKVVNNKYSSQINFIILLSVFFLTFYVIAIYWSFKAYKEFKGNAEDILGGPEVLTEQTKETNIVAYGIIP